MCWAIRIREQVLEQYVTGANLSLTPFATWAGDVSIAIGGEYRKEEVGLRPGRIPAVAAHRRERQCHRRSQPLVGRQLSAQFRVSYNVKEAYLETVVPLGFGLEFNGAVRATDYSTVGLCHDLESWARPGQPIDDIRFRVTRSRDIRAPNLNELFQAGTANSDSVRNPGFVNGTSPSFVPTGLPAQSASPIRALRPATPICGPEKSNQWNIGGVFTPPFLPGFNLAVDYFRIDLNRRDQLLQRAASRQSLLSWASRHSATRSPPIRCARRIRRGHI